MFSHNYAQIIYKEIILISFFIYSNFQSITLYQVSENRKRHEKVTENESEKFPEETLTLGISREERLVQCYHKFLDTRTSIISSELSEGAQSDCEGCSRA